MNRRALKRTSRTSQRAGFSLIELMIATAVFSIGMGGMSALMLSAAGRMSEAEHVSLAHLHADAMAATLQMSPLALEHLVYPPETSPHCFETIGCDNHDWLVNQYLLWRSQVARDLPGGAGAVCRDSTPVDGGPASPSCDGAGPIVTKVFWVDPRRTDDADGGVRRAVMQVPR